MLYQKEQLELLAINWNKTKSRSILRGDRISWTGLRAGNTRERSIGLLAAVGGTEQRLGPVTTREGDSGEGGGGGVIMIRQGLLMSGICGDWTWWGLVCPGSGPDTITTNYSQVRPWQISNVKTNWTRHEILWRFEDYWQNAFNKSLKYSKQILVCMHTWLCMVNPLEKGALTPKSFANIVRLNLNLSLFKINSCLRKQGPICVKKKNVNPLKTEL